MFILKKIATSILMVSTLSVAPAWAASLSFIPSANTVTAGQTVNVDVWISGLTSEQDLGAFDFNINFDNSILSFGNYSLSNNLGDLIAFEAFDTSAGLSSNGKLNLSEVSLLSDLSSQTSSFMLASITFTGLSSGNSQLSFSDTILGDAFGNSLTATLGTAAISVTPVASVPEPESYAMLLAGMGIFGFARRKQ